MHRGLAYDITRTKRMTTNNRKTSNYFPQPSATGGANSAGAISNQDQQHPQATTLTIPTNTYQQQQQQSQQNADQQQQATMNNGAGVGVVGAGQLIPQLQLKVEKTEKVVKKKSEKRFICCYCPWSGTDNWGLKRHLNTHTKPYVCMLCDYKAARSERLATHVFKVHNKKVCGKCNFLADTQEEYQTHVNEAQ